MQRMVSGILRQYGTTMNLVHEGNAHEIRGFFQPVQAKGWQNMEKLVTPLGEGQKGQYLWIGPGNLEVSEGDFLVVGEKKYMMHRAEQWFYGEEPVYTWAICVQKGGRDEWGS